MFQTLILIVFAVLSIREAAVSSPNTYNYAKSQGKIVHIQRKVKEITNALTVYETKLKTIAKDFGQNLLKSSEHLNKSLSLVYQDDVYSNYLLESLTQINNATSTLHGDQEGPTQNISKQIKTALAALIEATKTVSQAFKHNQESKVKQIIANLVVYSCMENLLFTLEQLHIQLLLVTKATTIDDLILATIVDLRSTFETITSNDRQVKEDLLFTARRLGETIQNTHTKLSVWLKTQESAKVKNVDQALEKLYGNQDLSLEVDRDVNQVKDSLEKSTYTYLTEIKNLLTVEGGDFEKTVIDGVTAVKCILADIKITSKIGAADVIKLALYIKEVEFLAIH